MSEPRLLNVATGDEREKLLADKEAAIEEQILRESLNNTMTVVKDNSNRAVIQGLPYAIEARGESLLVSLDLFKSGYECKKCKGLGKTKKQVFESGVGMVDKVEPCPECKGKGALLIFVDASKSLPTTGVVLSLGAKVKTDAPDLKLYDRVLFGPHSGQFIPIRGNGNILLKMLHYRECTGIIHGGEDLSSFDLVAYDRPIGVGE